MEKLMKFTEAIRTVKSSSDPLADAAVATESYHGQVMEEDDFSYSINDKGKVDKQREELDGWFIGKLKCKRHIDDSYRDTVNNNTGDGRRVDDYAVIDPRKKR